MLMHSWSFMVNNYIIQVALDACQVRDIILWIALWADINLYGTLVKQNSPSWVMKAVRPQLSARKGI